MISERTKHCKKCRNVFFILSTLCWIGLASFMVISVFSKIGGSKGTEILSEALKDKLVSIATTTIIGVVLALFIKDKARTLIYMFCVIIGSLLYHEAGMYVSLAIWGLDEYIIYTLYKYFKSKVSINKEIDLR